MMCTNPMNAEALRNLGVRGTSLETNVQRINDADVSDLEENSSDKPLIPSPWPYLHALDVLASPFCAIGRGAKKCYNRAYESYKRFLGID